ncbi:hypothetical protein HPB52_013223 [Rhipicephalus sanguineus]|uniref:Uncharacterized protein n=1 Tax=Rhipicephalus sanguineus TaxID=34632 RepID=A0A9D4Q728_RHISA|nr:hypothetical protein HPB52_013223 [Rhipicephalus sanguineus]
MLPQLCPPVPPFHPIYPRAWFMRLDAILAVNGIKAQPMMHAVLLNALPVELCHLAAESSSSPRPYDDLCAAVLACYGQTYRPLPGSRELQISPPSQGAGPIGPEPSLDQDFTSLATTPPTSRPATSASIPTPDHPPDEFSLGLAARPTDMVIHEVEGEELPPAEILEDGEGSWRQVYARARKPASSPQKTTPDVNASKEQPQKTLPSARRNAPRPPPLPADDYKIVLRIRGGLSCADIPLPKLIYAVLQAAALTSSLHDQYRINSVSNILLISTPDSARTEAYLRIKTIKMDERSFEVVTHITDPSNTCRGVIRNIPVEHTAETILSSLLDYDRLGLILTGSRMGATTSILVTFRGTRVPFYISYQGGITRCVPYRHKTEACTLCRKLGHRPDVCLGAPQSLCPMCGIPNPLLDHECQPKCVVCHNDHPTGSPQCPQRYKPKPKHPPSPFSPDAAPFSDPSTSFKNTQRGRSPSLTRQQRRSRSRSRSKSIHQDPVPRTGPGHEVGWADAASPESSIQKQLKQMQDEMAKLRAENAKLRLELQSFKQPPTSTHPPSSPPNPTPISPLPAPPSTTPIPRDPAEPPAQKRKASTPTVSFEERVDQVEAKMERVDKVEEKEAQMDTFKTHYKQL